jgi:hypothetical protein
VFPYAAKKGAAVERCISLVSSNLAGVSQCPVKAISAARQQSLKGELFNAAAKCIVLGSKEGRICNTSQMSSGEM